jgi:hypothetical protein
MNNRPTAERFLSFTKLGEINLYARKRKYYALKSSAAQILKIKQARNNINEFSRRLSCCNCITIFISSRLKYIQYESTHLHTPLCRFCRNFEFGASPKLKKST